MDHARAEDFFRRLECLHSRREREGVKELFSHDVEVQDDGGEPVHGRTEMEDFLDAVWRAFPDFRVELVDGPFLASDGSGFAVWGRLSGTMRGPLDPPGFAPTGRRVSTDFGGFYESRGDLLCRARIIIDTRAIAVQIGALPPRGSRGEWLAVRLQRLQALGLRARFFGMDRRRERVGR